MSDLFEQEFNELLKDNPRLRKLAEEATEYGRLKEDPAWLSLFARVKAQKERFLLSFARRLMVGEIIPQREIDYNRGFYDGAFYAVAHPDKAVASLETAARIAYELKLGEELVAQADQSPYKIGGQ